MIKKLVPIALIASLCVFSVPAWSQDKTMLNASFDVARELFAAINPKFIEAWKAQSGQTLRIDQSYAGTSRQAQDIIQGKKVDVVTFNQVPDVDLLAQRGFLKKDWAKQYPNNSSPYFSTIAFLVRKGNPKHVKSWDDLVRDDVKLVFPNPKTSGNARYSYLGAWLYAHEKFAGDDKQTRAFVAKMLHNVENFPTGGRGATVAFAQNGQGDVLLTFESEVVNIAASDEFKAAGLEVVIPPVSVLAEFPVAIVDKVVDEKGTRAIADAYLKFQYTREMQLLLTAFNYRVANPEVMRATKSKFPDIRLVDPTKVLGSWDQIQTAHFATNGILDQVMTQK